VPGRKTRGRKRGEGVFTKTELQLNLFRCDESFNLPIYRLVTHMERNFPSSAQKHVPVWELPDSDNECFTHKLYKINKLSTEKSAFNYTVKQTCIFLCVNNSRSFFYNFE